ncbi:MAG: prenyltransferase/squalene oxidase repeat-containing protein [Planctomycetota bacterium]
MSNRSAAAVAVFARFARTVSFCVAGVALVWALSASPCGAVTPSSPEVQALVKKGLGYLTKSGDTRLGGKCVVALAFIKQENPQKNHPRVKEALQACIDGTKLSVQRLDMYSNGLAIIFLCELDPRAHGDLIRHYLGVLKKRQKDHGGWGYNVRKTGDTSQSQYAALSYWEAHNNGFSVEAASAAKLADWLIHTQDPSGGWGYQGRYAKKGEEIEQEEVTCSMLAAAMGSALITADLFGLAGKRDAGRPLSPVPAALLAGKKKRKRAANLRSAKLDADALFKAIERGNAWMDKNYRPSLGRYDAYYLYSLERYRSFQEEIEGIYDPEPDWYNAGYEFLKSKQKPDGSWSMGCGQGPDTAFAILFLIRSTQGMFRQKINDTRKGLVGFPKPSPNLKFENGEFVRQQTQAKMDDLLGLLSDDQAAELDGIADDPTSLVVTGDVDEATARRLQQIVRGGGPAARLIAVRTLGRTGDLDHVPTLLYALTDPDARVTIQARDALRFISRRFAGFGLTDKFTERERYSARDKWQEWYLSVRPDAVISLN